MEGFRSWVGEGARLREADCRVDARVAAGLEAMVFGGVGVVWGWVGERERDCLGGGAWKLGELVSEVDWGGVSTSFLKRRLLWEVVVLA